MMNDRMKLIKGLVKSSRTTQDAAKNSSVSFEVQEGVKLFLGYNVNYNKLSKNLK